MNAFNSRLGATFDYLAVRKCYYVNDRFNIYNRRRYMEETIDSWCSILGPEVWDIFHNKLLRLQMRERVTLIEYTDDVSAVIILRDIGATRMLLVKSSVTSWLDDHGLEIATCPSHEETY